jgi:hypothetical protein
VEYWNDGKNNETGRLKLETGLRMDRRKERSERKKEKCPVPPVFIFSLRPLAQHVSIAQKRQK